MALKIPGSLVRHLQEGRCVLFAGAGLSAQARLPNWGTLLGAMVQAVAADEPDEDSLSELKKLLDAGRYLDVADECKERLGAGYAELLSKTLQVAGPVPEAHRLVMELPFAAWITTNYDKLLEQAHVEVRGNVPKTLTHLDADTFGTLLFDGAPFILKAHGDMDKPESLVFTTRDYREIIHSNPAFNAVFSAILLTRAVLFVGYSLNDPDFRLLLDRQLTTFKKFVPERYAIMSDVGDVEREVLRRTAQIKVISYPAGQHEQLVEFLRNLKAQLAPPPAVAAAAPGAAGAVEFEQAAKAEEVTRRAPPPAGGGGRASAPPRNNLSSTPPPTAQPPAPMSAPPSRPGAAVQPSKPVALALTAHGNRVMAVLKDGSGEILAQGTAPAGTQLVKPMAKARTDPEYRAIGAALRTHLHSGVLQALETAAGAAGVILELDSELEAKPWELLEVRGKPLALQVPTWRAPVGLSAAARGRPHLHPPLTAILVGDPTEELPGARKEIEALAKLYPMATVLMGREATLEAVLGHLAGPTAFDVIHFAGHAWYDAQDVYLALAGGVHLTDDAIRPALSHFPPCVLVLNSHYTAFIPPGVSTSGPDALKATPAGRIGFTEVAMRSGAGAFVGCFGSPSDEGAAAIAVAFHQALLGGASVAQALLRARQQPVAPEDATPLLYSLSGYGDLTIR